MYKEKPNYYAVIPADVRYSNLSSSAKLMYGEITALCNKDARCWATNAYFAKLYGVTTRQVTTWIKSLVDSGFITMSLTKASTGIEVTRVLYLTNKTSIPHEQNFSTGVEENFQENTTSINITNNTHVDTNVSSSTGVDIKALFSELVGLLGYTDAVKYTDGRKRKLQARVRISSPDELRRAAQAIAADDYMQGDNPSGRRYGDIDYLIRSDEQVDKWIQKAQKQVTYQADW